MLKVRCALVGMPAGSVETAMTTMRESMAFSKQGGQGARFRASGPVKGERDA